MAGVVLFMLRRPAVAIAAVLCMFGLEQWAQSQGGYLATHTTLANLVVGLIVVFGCCLMLVRGRLDLRYPMIGWVVLALLAFSLISFFWTIDRGAFVQQWRLTAPYLVTIVVLLPLLICDWNDVRSGLLATLALGAVTLALLAFTSEWTFRGVAFNSANLNQMGNPLAVASLGAYVVLIAALMNFQGAARFWQLLRWPVVLLGVYITVRSGSRGQALGLLMAVLCFLPISRRFANIKGFVSTALGVLLVGTVAVWAQQQLAVGGRWQLDVMTEVYASGRLGGARTVLSAWLNGGPIRWLIGIGNSGSFHPNVWGFYPHLVAAEVLAEEGLIGFSLLVGIVLLAMRAVFRCYRSVAHDPVSRGVLAAVASLFLFTVVLSFKQGSLTGSPFMLGFAIMLGRMEMALRHVHVSTIPPLPAKAATSQWAVR